MGCSSSSVVSEPKERLNAQIVESSVVEAFDTADDSELDTLNSSTTAPNTVIEWDWKPALSKSNDSDSDSKNTHPLPLPRNASDQDQSGPVPMDRILELEDFEETEFDAPAVNAPVLDGRNSTPAHPPR